MPECVIRKVWAGWFVECDADHRARRFISASLERVLFIFIKCWSCQLILLEECNPRPGSLGNCSSPSEVKLVRTIAAITLVWSDTGHMEDGVFINSDLLTHNPRCGMWSVCTGWWSALGWSRGVPLLLYQAGNNWLIVALFPDLAIFLLDLNVVSSQICRPIRLWWRV